MAGASLQAGLSAYVHIPFCAARCGYCDFNTYTKLDFPGGASLSGYRRTLEREIELSRHALGVASEPPSFQTVFFGGGTPTMLPPSELAAIVESLRAAFGLAPDAEVTTEANPETVTQESLEALAAGGFTRISFGMQSASERVLRLLDRAHSDGQVARAVGWARSLGLETSVDLIYGTPTETAAEWDRSLHEAIGLGVDHVSAYALTIEPGTKMGAKARRGELPGVDEDTQAERYERADEILSAAGLAWYEISNWARPGHECRHNMVYWRGGNWWGYGPGAHTHIDGTRLWNLKHPLAYAAKIANGELGVDGFERLTRVERAEEQVMLAIRLSEGFTANAQALERLAEDGLVEFLPSVPTAASAAGEAKAHARLTLRGRLLADEATRRLWDFL